MADITYCMAPECPFKDCECHCENLRTQTGVVSIAYRAGTCRRYIGWLVNQVKENV